MILACCDARAARQLAGADPLSYDLPPKTPSQQEQPLQSGGRGAPLVSTGFDPFPDISPSLP